MPSIITTIPDADFSGLGLGLADTPFSVRPWAGYVLGTSHVAGTDYTNLQDFCGSQGALIAVGSHSASAYYETLTETVYYNTPFTLAELFAAGSGSASMVLVAKPSLANVFGMGAIEGSGAKFNITWLLETSPAENALVALADDASNTANFNLAVPGSDASAQFTMLAASATPTAAQGYFQNINGTSTAGPISKTSGTYTASSPISIGYSQGVGAYTGTEEAILALFFTGNQDAYFPTLYTEIAAWMNEHSLGF